MANRLIGTDDANPRLPASVIAATQGTTAADLSPGDTVRLGGGTMTGTLQVGDAPATGEGTALLTTGRVNTSITTSTQPNLQVARGGATSGANAQRLVGFWRGTAAANPLETVIGTITIATGTTVAYNTSSDRRLKTLTRVVDPGEALDKVNAAEPIHFTWTAFPGDGEQIGFFAQDLQPVAPEVVTPGEGEPGDDDFIPWMLDNAKLVPTLVAAIQALTRRIEQLETT